MSYTIKILPKDINVEVEQGTSLLDVQIKAGLQPDAPCGGAGTCGKCLVDVLLANGTFETVKACQTLVDQDMTIRVKEETTFHVLESGTKRSFALNPGMSLEEIKAKKALGAAFDIGTTSVVCYLLDLETGEELAHASMLNPQSQFGADVISRCEYAIANGVDTLSTVIHTALNELLNEACKNAGRAKEEIYIASIVGNTCMHHLYLGINPQSLTVVPYEATVKDEMVVKPEEVELEINKDGIVQILPNIAGFVGADTVGCLLATAFDEIEEMTLMIDIGTNGEMVMGNKDHMIACSTAAGPAFEGAKIECGMRGKDGAI
ncbi:MAG: ASKHA domain-containing protein, partial [Lachnospiraceae bacterium]|nr:ASKHA domain-containing protein [Lachnospiraceae bacterium]